MNGFEVYKIYLAMKLHFTSKKQSYDYHRHAGKTTARLATFTKRRDRYFFHKLSRTYSDTDIANYLSVILFLILICGLGILLVNLVTKIINRGREG